MTNEVETPYLPNHRIMTKTLKARKVTQKTKTQYYLKKRKKKKKKKRKKRRKERKANVVEQEIGVRHF